MYSSQLVTHLESLSTIITLLLDTVSFGHFNVKVDSLAENLAFCIRPVCYYCFRLLALNTL